MSENTPASPEASAAPWKLLQMMTGYWVTQALYVAAKTRNCQPASRRARQL